VTTHVALTSVTCSWSAVRLHRDNRFIWWWWWWWHASFLTLIFYNEVYVATPLRCGEIVNDRFITNFLQSVKWNNFWHRSVFGEYTDESLMSSRFLTHGVLLVVCTCWMNEWMNDWLIDWLIDKMLRRRTKSSWLCRCCMLTTSRDYRKRKWS